MQHLPPSAPHLPATTPAALVGADPTCPSRLTWFLAGAAFGMVAYPFYAVFLGLPDGSRRRRARA